MLKGIELKNFKSFRDQRVPMAPLTLLVGANATGKSNVLDALRFLQGAALDIPIAEVLRGRWEGGREIWPGIRGGSAETTRGKNDGFQLKTSWTFDEALIEHCLSCATGKHPHVLAESLLSNEGGRYLFDTHAESLGAGAGRQDGGGIAVALRRKGKGRAVSAVLSSERSMLGQLKKDEHADPRVFQRAEQVRSALRSMLFLDITPHRMRGYVPQSAQNLGAEGENLSAVVYNWCQTKGSKQDLIDWLSELCAPELTDLDFIQTELGDVMLQLIEADGTKVSARSLSDGTLRFLGEVMALITAPTGSVLFIEEIENGLHPTRAGLLVDLLTQVTKSGVQVVATTHSPLVLDALARTSHDALDNVVLLAREADDEGTQARRLGDLKHFEEVLAKRGIEYLFTTKWLERAL